MACSLKNGFRVPGINEAAISSRKRRASGFCCSVSSWRTNGSNYKELPLLTAEFMGKQVLVSDRKEFRLPANFYVNASGCVSRAMRWWEKSLKPNMVEIHSAQELVRALLCAGDSLVVVDFYSPGCGGCRALHPKISQLAELYPDTVFLKVNQEKLRTMCHCLNIHVLPFFRFYRGAEGRVCSFSCTNATIKKFKDAVAKHGSERCSIGPAKGLDDSELLRLVSCGEILPEFPSSSEADTSLEMAASTKDGFAAAISGMTTTIEESHSLLNV